MLRGIYIAGSGMTERAANLDVLANNIANLQTNTFKRDRVAYSDFRNMMLRNVQDGKVKEQVGNLAMGAVLSTDTFTDFTQGPLTQSGNDHDVAIEGKGFVKLQLPDNSIRYTRDANWNLTNEGLLVDKNGFPILDENNSEIKIQTTGKLLISANGEIHQDGNLVGKIGIVEIDDTRFLDKEGDSMYYTPDNLDHEIDPVNTSLRQGYVERANFSPLAAVTEMIKLMREYESSQKVLQTVDETVNEAISKLGSVQA